MKKDLINGNIFKTLVTYSIPLVITNVVQVLFHSVDVAVLSFMAGDDSVAAVGACGPIVAVLISLCTGFSTGANILIARRIGARDEKGVKRATGTALVLGVILGLILMVITLVFARQFLILMKCQPDVIDMATVYMRIYFLGMPIIMTNNFIIGILRASGDSVKPMKFLLASGFINVILNVFFVGVFRIEVEGVAIATVLSSLVSLICGLIELLKNKEMCRVEKKHLRIRRQEFFKIFQIAVPASMGGLCYYVANLFASAAVNSMSTESMTANAMAGQLDGVIYTVGNAIAAATMTMVGQNFGACRFDRIQKTIRTSVVYVSAVSILLGVVFVVFAEPLLGILTDSPTVIELAKNRMTFLCLTYFVTSIMEVFSFSLNSLGRQRDVLIVCIICGFAIRSMWIWFVWPLHKTLAMLFASYTVSALVAILCYLVIYSITVKKLKKSLYNINQGMVS